MRVLVKHGDIFAEKVDVFISTANPQLNMSGGINGEILVRGGHDVQRQLHAHLQKIDRRFVNPGSVVVTGPGPLSNVKHIVHAVAIDVWYQSNISLVATAIENALTAAAELGASTAALPGLAMGYGPLSASKFAEGLKLALAHEYVPIEELRVVLHRKENADVVESVLASES